MKIIVDAFGGDNAPSGDFKGMRRRLPNMIWTLCLPEEAEIRRVAEETRFLWTEWDRGYPDMITMEDHAGIL